MRKRIILIALTLVFAVEFCFAEGQAGLGAFIAIVTLFPILIGWIIISSIIAYIQKKKENSEITTAQIFLFLGIGALLIWLAGLVNMGII